MTALLPPVGAGLGPGSNKHKSPVLRNSRTHVSIHQFFALCYDLVHNTHVSNLNLLFYSNLDLILFPNLPKRRLNPRAPPNLELKKCCMLSFSFDTLMANTSHLLRQYLLFTIWQYPSPCGQAYSPLVFYFFKPH